MTEHTALAAQKRGSGEQRTAAGLQTLRIRLALTEHTLASQGEAGGRGGGKGGIFLRAGDGLAFATGWRGATEKS